MKKIKLLTLLSLVLFLCMQTLDAQRQMNPQLKALQDEKDTTILAQKLSELRNSSNEIDLRLLIQYYGMHNQAGKAEEIFKLAQEKFPNGESAFISAGNAIILESNPAEKEKLYKSFIRKFPGKAYSMQQYSIADAYAQLDNKKKVREYAGMFKDSFYRDQFFQLLAEQLLKVNDANTAEYLIKRAVSSSKQQMENFDTTQVTHFGNSQRPRVNPKTQYYSFLTTYAKVLFKEGKVDEAYRDIKEAYENSNRSSTDMSDFYITVLLAKNKMKEALPLMETAMKQGWASEQVQKRLEDAYVAVNGSETGFAEYKQKLDLELEEKAKEMVAKLIINKPSTDFTLTDVDGNTVSLHDLKGKTVILDFWATWCGPCKKSFPAMQLAVNKYKNDPNVKFLFIHTWERGNIDPAVDAKKYVTDHKYSFEVLIDRKNTETGVNKVVTDYGVSGIPTKFIIDPQGNIRFKFVGFSGGDYAALAEISAMIEMSRKS